MLLLAVLPLCITEVRRVIHFCDNCRIILRCWRLLIVFCTYFLRFPAAHTAMWLIFPKWNCCATIGKVIREEALALNDGAKITASDDLDDVGFNSFFAQVGAVLS